MLVLAEQGDTKKIFKEAGLSEKLKAVIEQLRGEQTVDSQNAEDQRDALNKYTINLTERGNG